MSPVATEMHEVENTLRVGLRVEELLAYLHPGMVVRGPENHVRKEAPSVVSPVITMTSVDALEIVVPEVPWEEVTSDECPVELGRHPNHCSLPLVQDPPSNVIPRKVQSACARVNWKPAC